jgi:hypothetical protein
MYIEPIRDRQNHTTAKHDELTGWALGNDGENLNRDVQTPASVRAKRVVFARITYNCDEWPK